MRAKSINNKSFLITCCLFLQVYLGVAQIVVPYRNGNDWYLSDVSNHRLTDVKYDNATASASGIVFVCRNNKWGAIGLGSRTILPCEYSKVELLTGALLKVSKDGHCAIFDTTGRNLSGFPYIQIKNYRFDTNLFVAQDTTRHWCILNSKGRLYIPDKFLLAPVHTFDSCLITCTEINGQPCYGVTDKNFKTIIPNLYEEIEPFRMKYFLCKDTLGNNILLDLKDVPIYTGIGEPTWIGANFAYINNGDSNGVYCLRSKSVYWMKEGENSDVDDANGYCSIRDNQDNVYKISSDGRIIKPPDGYSFLVKPNSTYLIFQNKSEGRRRGDWTDSKMGVVDEKGNVIVKPTYQQIKAVSYDYCVFAEYSKGPSGKGMIEKDGILNIKKDRVVVPPKYQDIKLISSDCIALKDSTGYTLCNKKLKPLSQAKYDMIDATFNPYPGHLPDGFPGKMRCVGTYNIKGKLMKGATYGYIDSLGNELIHPVFRQFSGIGDVYGVVSNAALLSGTMTDSAHYYGYCVLIKKDGTILTPQKYSAIIYSIGKYIVVNQEFKIDGTPRRYQGLIDSTGKELITPAFDRIVDIRGANVIVEKNSKTGLHSISNKEIIPLNYSSITFLNDTLLLVSHGSSYGIIDTKGKERIPVKYTHIDKQLYLNGNVVLVSTDNQTFYVNSNTGIEYRNNVIK